MAREWKLVEIKGSTFIPFEWKDSTPGGKNLGRAEFHVCVRFKKNKVYEFWVYPVQTHIETYWHYSGGDVDFSISAYEDLESEGAWRAVWCKEHKTTSLCIYSPVGAKFLEIDCHGLSFWKNDYTKEKA